MVDKTRYPPGGVSAEAVQEIRRIKARVDAERLPRGADPNTHTKLGRGGLADIEWTVQLLQLRHAHKMPALHNTSTLETLNAIGAAELIAEGDVELLRQAWLTATRARNALVLVRGKPTDQLPGPGRQLNAVARGGGLGHRRRRRVPRQLPAGDPPGKGGGTEGVRWLSMSMDFGFDVISAEEYERQHALYGPLTEALRKLIDAGIHTEVDEDTVRDAQSAIEAATEMLERKQRTVTSTLRHEGTGRPLAWANPAVGLRNAIAPPMVIHHEADGRCLERVHPRAARTKGRRDGCTAASARWCSTTSSARRPATG